jgi:2-dehydro-3-deoxygluconokinase
MTPPDVVVLGEALVELASPEPLRSTSNLDLSFSGDSLNAGAAAVAAGATVALLTRVGDDEFGDRLVAFAAGVGIDTRHMLRTERPNGVYFVGADPDGTEEFVYLRAGSAATTYTTADLPQEALRGARALLTSGIACAISPTMRAAVEAAIDTVAASGGLVVYDPNFRRRLTDQQEARAAFAAVAPRATIVTPSCPADTRALFDTEDPQEAAGRCLAAGAPAAAITLGADGVLLARDGERTHFPAYPPPALVDATGSGDILAGTLAARLALGERLEDALRAGMAAASLSLAGRGGLGSLSRWEAVRAHASNGSAGRHSTGEELTHRD